MKQTLQHITCEGLQQLAENHGCEDRFKFSHLHVTIKPKKEHPLVKWIILGVMILIVMSIAAWYFYEYNTTQVLLVAAVIFSIIYWFNDAQAGKPEVTVDLETRQFIFVPVNTFFPRKKEAKRIDIATIDQVELELIPRRRHLRQWYRIIFYDKKKTRLAYMNFDPGYDEDFIAKKLYSFFDLVVKENKKIEEKCSSQ